MNSEEYVKTIEGKIGVKRSKRYYKNRIWDIKRLIKIAEQKVGCEVLDNEIVIPLLSLNQNVEEELENFCHVLKYFESLSHEKAVSYSKNIEKVLNDKKIILNKNREIIPDYCLSSTYENDFLKAYQEALSENRVIDKSRVNNLEKFLGVSFQKPFR